MFQSHTLCNLRGFFILILCDILVISFGFFPLNLFTQRKEEVLSKKKKKRERKRYVCFCFCVCQQVFLFCLSLSLSVQFVFWENAGSEEGDELEKGGQVTPSYASSCLALLLHSSSFSQAWPSPPLLMVVSFFLHSLYLLFFVTPFRNSRRESIKG